MASIITGNELELNMIRPLYNIERQVTAVQNVFVNMHNVINMVGVVINNNTNAQEDFNKKVKEGEKSSNKLADSIKKVTDKYLSMENFSKILDLSDSMVRMAARLEPVNDGLQSTQELSDAVYVSAQRAHIPFLDMADAVASLGNSAGQTFGSSMELVAFLEQANKQMAMGGASAKEQSEALSKLCQVMEEGVLKGDNLNTVLNAAPGIADTIEQSMGWAEGSLNSYAEKGMVTAAVVKNSFLNMADATNEKFASMPTSFSQAAENLKNGAIRAFQPVLQRISNIFNSQQFASFAQGVIEVFAVVSNMVLNLMDLAGTIGSFFQENLSVIAPLILGIAAALLVCATAVHAEAVAKKIAKAATNAWEAAQKKLHAVMAMNPVLLIVIAVILLIAVIYSVCAAIAKATGVAQSGFGVFCGAVKVVIAALENFRLFVLNVFIGIGSAVLALKYNIIAAFVNVAARLESIWNSILATVLTVIADILDAISDLPFIGIDYSGLSAGIRKAAEFSEEIAENLKNIEMEYKDPLEAFKEGFSTFEAFEDGWQKEAFEKGAAWGDGVAEKVGDKLSGFSLSDIFGAVEMPGMDDYQYLHNQEEMFNNVEEIADNTSDISDSVSVSQEDLSYLRDLAAQEAINRFTTASINVEMNTHNNISREADLDGIVDGLTGKVLEAMELVQEGV